MKQPNFHPRNRYQGQYDFSRLEQAFPGLGKYIRDNSAGESTINFSDPLAVKSLNKALLLDYYELSYWDIPDGYLCPGLPGRAEYIHRIADLLAEDNLLQGDKVLGLDVGTGANAIYPLLGILEYDWKMVGSDINTEAITAAQLVVDKNPVLQGKFELRLQARDEHFFRTVIQEGEHYCFSVCNPPFHTSSQEARKANERKNQGLGIATSAALNFGGRDHELWFPGGEERFLRMLAQESKHYREQCLWFSSLLSSKDNLRPLKKVLKKVGIEESRVLPITIGHKQGRVVAWTFHSLKSRKQWQDR